MEDCCAVCAEPLEWVAYGPCGHREVCSTCTARMRVVLGDKRCCICKQECVYVFVTKDLGDYTVVVTDFDALPSKAHLWYDRLVQGYFDDEEEYNRIKAMCTLQCIVCDTADASRPKALDREGHVLKTLDLLRQHLLTIHKVAMCELCLEGRKVFITEQKLYTKSQLERHCSKGDTRVDGSIGFNGHPICEFCRKRFYGENELYHHMSTEHYTCHFCRRDRPGEHDYFQHYDDLEAHFRNHHFLCEDPECLTKKFIVFRTESEFKIHNAKEHGNSLKRAERNAALKIPVSLQVRRPDQGYSYRGELSAAESSVFVIGGGPAPRLMQSSLFEPRYPSALDGAGSSFVDTSAFPPLPGTSRRRAKQRNQVISTTAPKVKVSNTYDGSIEVSSSRSSVSENIRDSSERRRLSNAGAGGQDGIKLTIDEIRAATKRLLQQIRALVNGDEKRLAEFKEIHAEFRRGSLSSKGYYDRVAELGISNIIPELARLCPDPQKQRELLQAHMTRAASDNRNFPPASSQTGSFSGQAVPSTRKLKGKDLEALVNVNPGIPGSSAEIPGFKGKSKVSESGQSSAKLDCNPGSTSASSSWACEICTLINEASSLRCAACGISKKLGNDDKIQDKRKKAPNVPKVDRARLGDIPVTGENNNPPATAANGSAQMVNATGHGAWKNNGGLRLLAQVKRESIIYASHRRKK